MEPDTPLTPAPKSSLIVKSHQSLCAKCTEMLLLCCNAPGQQHPSLWTWTIDALKQASLRCHCCRFLLQVLEASPWIQYENHDQLVVEICNVGSQQTSPNHDAPELRSYYRPLLYVDSHSPTPLERFSLILPVPQATGDDSEECDIQTFCGRSVNAMVDLPLIASWHRTCTLTHHDSAEGHGCSPRTHETLQDFRVIDVRKRCVIRPNAKFDYAALSYVWGNAKRLLLCKDNEAWLSTPGALSRNEESVPRTFRDALEVAAALEVANLWVDALCIDQTNLEQVKQHMNAMDSIYGSAVVTIVATTENANSGLPGINLPRGPPQAVFQHDGARYMSSKPTFGAALQGSPWERRAWCLQEKLFSTRLLVFTVNQAFYHCGAATWFEDTIMEPKKINHDPVHLKERISTYRKRKSPNLNVGKYSAYESRRKVFKDKNLWSLVESYSRREISFEADIIRAFGGILRSVEAKHGRAIWGIPQYHFLRGLS